MSVQTLGPDRSVPHSRASSSRARRTAVANPLRRCCGSIQKRTLPLLSRAVCHVPPTRFPFPASTTTRKGRPGGVQPPGQELGGIASTGLERTVLRGESAADRLSRLPGDRASPRVLEVRLAHRLEAECHGARSFIAVPASDAPPSLRVASPLARAGETVRSPSARRAGRTLKPGSMLAPSCGATSRGSAFTTRPGGVAAGS